MCIKMKACVDTWVSMKAWQTVFIKTVFVERHVPGNSQSRFGELFSAKSKETRPAKPTQLGFMARGSGQSTFHEPRSEWK